MSTNFQMEITFPRQDSPGDPDGRLSIFPLAGGVTLVQLANTTNYTPNELRLIADALKLAADHATEPRP